jgi:hypothetical protein
MQNIFDYLEWRGDLSFDCDSFNEVDNLIFSILAYLEFDGIVPREAGTDSISLLKAAEGFEKSMDKSFANNHNPFLKQIPKLLSKAAKTKRYGNIQLSGYENQVDYEQHKQFSALVFSINSEQHFIAFRGTDDTLIGWQEDLQMSFMDEVQAQKQSVIYMNRVFSNFAGDFYLGGHSKGGNLAVYAITSATGNVQDRIIGIYNNDGPGFQKNIIQSEGYQNILGKIRTLMPKSSVVGMMLERGEEYKVVRSCKTGIMQHDAFSWEVKGTNFVYEKRLTKKSSNLNNTVRECINKLSIEERSQFVDALFGIIESTGAKTVGELSKEKLVAAYTMIKTYKNMDTLAQSHLKKIIEIFFEESQKTLRNSISEDISGLFSKKKLRKGILK